MSVTVSYLNYEEANVGRLVKSSKKKVLWLFAIDAQEHLVELFHSRVSNKQRVFLDRYLASRLSPYHGTSALHKFNIGEVLCSIELVGSRFELTVNGTSFDEIKLAVSCTAPLYKGASAAREPVTSISPAKENRKEAIGLGFDEWDRRLSDSTNRVKRAAVPSTPNPPKKSAPPKPASEVKPATQIPDDLFSPPIQAPPKSSPQMPEFPAAEVPVFQINHLQPQPRAPLQQTPQLYPMMWSFQRGY
jgi:hypothetical protein